MQALLEEVVGELVAGTGALQQPLPDQVLAEPGGGQLGGLHQGGQQAGVDPAPQHRRRLDRRPLLGPQAAHPGEDGVGERVGHAGLALGEGAEALDDRQGVPGRPGHHLPAVPGQPGGRGQRVDRGAGERAEREAGRAVVESSGGRRVLEADRRHHQHARAAEPGRQVAEEVDGRGAAVLEVVEDQQHRAVEREPPEHGQHGVVGLAALQVDVDGQREEVAEHRREVRDQRGPGRLVPPDQRGQPRGRGVEQGRPYGVDVRLEEQRPLRGVAASPEHQTARAHGDLGDRVEEPGLADARLTLHEHEVTGVEGVGGADVGPRPLGRGQLGLAAEQADAGSRHAGARLGGQPCLTEDRQVQVCGVPVGRGAEVLAQPVGQVVVRRQGRAGPAVGDQRPHQVSQRLLVERVVGRRLRRYGRGLGRVERREHVRQQVPGPAPEAVGLAADRQHPVVVGLLGEGALGAEQVQGRPRRRGGERRLVRGRPVGRLAEQRRHLVEVHRPAAPVGQSVGPARCREYVGSEQPAGPADEGRHVGRGVGRRVVGPEGVDDAVQGDERAAFGGQQGQQGAALAAAQVPPGQRAARPVDRERRREPDPDGPVHVPSIRHPALRPPWRAGRPSRWFPTKRSLRAPDDGVRRGLSETCR